MNKKTICSVLTFMLLSIGLTLSGFNADAQSRKSSKTTRTAKTASASSAKVATELPDGFSAVMFLTYVREWESYQFSEDNAKKLVNMGFKLTGRGSSRVSMGSEDDSYTKVKNGTYSFEGIKVTLRGDGVVDKIVFPNKATLNQFLATALQNGMYENNYGEYYSFQGGGLCSFYVKGLTVVYDTSA